MYKFTAKLKRLQRALKDWNYTIFGDVFRNIKDAEAEVKRLEEVFDNTGLDRDLTQLNCAQAQLLRSLAEEEDFWRQKAREKWIKEGDRNTKFFHASVIEKRQRLTITKMKDSHGQWLTSEASIKDHAVEFYQTLFSVESHDQEEVDSSIDQFLSYVPELVTLEDNQRLLRPLTMEEVKLAVFQLDSAPGSDGFSGRFYQACWGIISPDLFNAVQEFFVGVPVPKRISSTLMVLLPKKPCPTSFGEYRPISLCNFVNKIFTRILCDRLRDLLPTLIMDEQSAFVRGRDISDNVLMAQEMLQHLDKRVRGHNVMFKLDMMKAFDRVSWNFLHRLLAKFGFHSSFIHIIMNNLQSSRFSVLINGSSAGFFPASRGLKQGLEPNSFYIGCRVIKLWVAGLTLRRGVGDLFFASTCSCFESSLLCGRFGNFYQRFAQFHPFFISFSKEIRTRLGPKG